MKKILLLAAVAFVAAGCTPPNQNMATTAQNTALGAAVGAGIGNLVGKDSEATATGAVIGGVLGSQMQTGNWGLGGSTPAYPQAPAYPQYNNSYNSGYNSYGGGYSQPYRPAVNTGSYYNPNNSYRRY